MKKITNCVVPSLLVNNIKETISFYKNLGFKLTGISNKENPKWAELNFEGAALQFFSDPPVGISDKPIMSGTIYLYCKDVQGLAEKLRNQIKLEWGPEEMEYGMLEFGIRDPNGYLIAFTQPAI